MSQPELLTGECYCGGVHFSFDSTVEKDGAAYCHCVDCRRSHAAPLYQCVYVNGDKQKAFQITKGQHLLKEFRKPGAPLIRAFCSACGTKICCRHDIYGTGWFPPLLHQPLPEKLRPAYHIFTKDTVMDLDKLKDGLPRANPEKAKL
eukprot:TRINITY_DN20019_c0_g1_i2.p2 TRINITY_DN20019_c0_g1~~TRINITY_DN20019_c0_g1_i2.p2  ORF type:complete len:147 (+),score=49.18 TRINITY_DN20019_c0_g1_i2:136-576(+)